MCLEDAFWGWSGFGGGLMEGINEQELQND
jgi:hypothetical protein